MSHFKSGFVNIIGRSNVGKSSIFNKILKLKLSIVTNKLYTTQKKISGIITKEKYQIILNDTVGINNFDKKKSITYINTLLEDTDILLYITDQNSLLFDNYIFKNIKHIFCSKKYKKIIIINKYDLINKYKAKKIYKYYKYMFNNIPIYFTSIINNYNIDILTKKIIDYLPYHPQYYDNETYTNKNDIFIIKELIREKILILFNNEIPYNTNIIVENVINDKYIIIINVIILVKKHRQKKILIGHNGNKIKKIIKYSKYNIKKFFKKKVKLSIYVKN